MAWVIDYIRALHRSAEEVARESNSPLVDTSDKSPEQVLQEVKKLYGKFCIASQFMSTLHELPCLI
jgi:hypothetical protein